MPGQDFTLAFTVDRSPEEVYTAVTDVRGWWSKGLEGRSAAAGDQFTYRHGDRHLSTHRVTEAVPGHRVVWRTVDADLPHADPPDEWIGTEVRFDIRPARDGTELRFTHVGLTPSLACYRACTRGWAFYVGESLRGLIATGRGKPDPAHGASADASP
jgi:uncharacterized protein YndB with AHSA1/START domain